MNVVISTLPLQTMDIFSEITQTSLKYQPNG